MVAHEVCTTCSLCNPSVSDEVPLLAVLGIDIYCDTNLSIKVQEHNMHNTKRVFSDVMNKICILISEMIPDNFS